jgi:predicted MPP superfamily phosphohydrolase
MPLSLQLAFLVVVTTLSALLHRYLWSRLVRLPGWPPRFRRVASGALGGLALALPLGLALSRLLPRPLARLLMWPLLSWLGVMFLLLVLLLPGELARLVAWAGRRLTGSRPTEPARRQAVVRLLSGAAGAGALLLGGAAMAQALKPPELKRVRIPLSRLPPGLEGFTLVQLTDIHVGPTIGRDFIESLVERTNALSPDVVAITGDLVDGSVEELGPLVEPLRHLKARHGVYFVTGNHEYLSGVEAWLAFLPTLGIRVLANERVRLTTPEGALELAGVHDVTAERFHPAHRSDLSRALEGRDASLPLLLLAHQPKSAPEAARAGVDLQLSGHTHGGQLFPFSLLVRLDTPFVRGLYRVEDLQLYVSCGTGYWGPPMRLGTEAEITHVVLTRPS